MIDASKIDNINTALSSKSTAQSNLDNTFNDFLTLLTTQLQNQDPTQPLDTNQITQQLASMSQVQEQINTNKKLEQLIALSGGSELDKAVSYIGRVVESEGNESLLLSNGEQQGALFAYDLPQEAMRTTITITDDKNKVVYSGEALTNAGRNEVVWDGANTLTGQTMPPGKYKFSIKALDYNGKEMKATTYTTGVVTSADTFNGEVTLSLGPIKLGLEDVLAIKSAQELL